MAPRYFRVSPRIWSEKWTDDARYVAFYLLTCEHRATEGLFRLPISYGTADLKWPARRFKKALRELIESGFCEYDDRAEVVLIVKALKYQALQNENQVVPALERLETLPETDLDFHFAQLAKRFCERLAKRLPERFAQWFGNALNSTPEDKNHLQEAEPDEDEVVAQNGIPLTPPEGQTLSETLAKWWREQNVDIPSRQSRSKAYRAVLEHTGNFLGAGHKSHRWACAEIISDAVRDGADEEMPDEGKSHLRRLVKLHGPLETFDACMEAVTWGAGINKAYAQDALALTKYATAVLKAHEQVDA